MIKTTLDRLKQELVARGHNVRSPMPHFQTAEELFEVLGITEPEDIHIEAIAQYCGATIVYEPVKGSDARLIGVGGKAFITVNSDVAPSRQRFSAAHELGHWMYDRGTAAFACGEEALTPPLTKGTINPERRANRYAVGLLMPRRFFSRSTAGKPLTFAAISEVAEQYRTSLSATAIRWVELTAKLVVLTGDVYGRKWTVRAPNVPEDWRTRLFVAHEEVIRITSDSSLTLTTLTFERSH